MIQVLILFGAMLCHNPSHKTNTPGCNKVHVTIMSNPDDNGETGHVPPKPPPPPPPPPGN